MAAPPARTTLAGSQPAWAKSAALRGAAPITDYVNIRVYLGWRDAAGAAALAAAVTTPSSPSYGKYVSAQKFATQFAPTQSDVAQVQKFLKDSGFTVVDTAGNNRYVAAEGTVAQAQAAFAVTLGEYTAYGQQLRAPESAVTVPSSVASVVQAVVGLDESSLLMVPNSSTGNGPSKQGGNPSAGFRVGQPCSLWYGEKTVSTPKAPAYGSTTKPLAVCGYTPAQVRGLYGLDSVAADGSGQTVAFVGANASPTLQQDVATYSQLHNLPAPSITEMVAPGVYHHAETKRNPASAFYGEETLDAEAIHTTAPGAHLLFVASANAGQDFDAAINHIVDKHLSNILSISYGWSGEALPQGFITALNNTFIEAAATGVGVYVSSGDNGDEVTNFGTPAVDFFADSPYVTAVGGTSAAITPKAGVTASSYAEIDNPASALNKPGWQRQFEVAWQTARDPLSGTLSGAGTSFTIDGTLAQPLPGDFFGGGGGGVSRIFGEPSYQKAAVGTFSGRVLPDISAVGDPNTGLLVGQTQQFTDGSVKYDEYRIGGTSLSAPLTAGMAAVADQIAGHPLGFLNPRIYAAYSAHSNAYYDVDQADNFGTTVKDPLPAEVRVNYNNSEDASGGLSFSLRTLESPAQTLHSTKGFDTATGVGTPNGQLFFTAITTP
ncbi:MAG: hypothetical protein QOK14_497 [Frankiaceae bacterium]|nr:hypothetical protein [Frankiaceae bacterium]